MLKDSREVKVKVSGYQDNNLHIEVERKELKIEAVCTIRAGYPMIPPLFRIKIVQAPAPV